MHGPVKFLVAARVSVTRTERPTFLPFGAATGEREPKEKRSQSYLICLFRRSPRHAPPSLFTALSVAWQEYTSHFSLIQQPPPRYYANEESFEAGPTNEMLFRLAVADSLCSEENVGPKGG